MPKINIQIFDPVSPNANRTYLRLHASIPIISVFLIPYLLRKIGSNKINNASDI